MLTAAARLALLLLALAACQPAPGPAESAASASPATPAVSEPAEAPTPAATEPAAAECPDPDFAAFLKRFEGSADAQRAATADPLTMVSIDPDAQPEPAPVSRQVPLAEVEFPVMGDASRRQAEGLEQVVQELAGGRQEVTVRVPDSGIQTRYEFHATPCWKLVRVSDDTF
jgi:hypothetical protein